MDKKIRIYKLKQLIRNNNCNDLWWAGCGLLSCPIYEQRKEGPCDTILRAKTAKLELKKLKVKALLENLG
jgi:hypothetical protein